MGLHILSKLSNHKVHWTNGISCICYFAYKADSCRNCKTTRGNGPIDKRARLHDVDEVDSTCSCDSLASKCHILHNFGTVAFTAPHPPSRYHECCTLIKQKAPFAQQNFWAARLTLCSPSFHPSHSGREGNEKCHSICRTIETN